MARGGIRGKPGRSGNVGNKDAMNIREAVGASLLRNAWQHDEVLLRGRYVAELVGPDGAVKWREEFGNTVTTAGKNAMLDIALANSGTYNAACHLGLISSVGYTTAPVVGDTMSSHGGWVEAGNGTNLPTWDTPASNARVLVTWQAAGSGAKQLSANASFVFDAAGTVKGCFMAFNGSTATNANTSGTLLSAGLFTADKTCGIDDTLNVSYSLTL